MKKMMFLLMLLISSIAYAGDYHQNDSQHALTYVILDDNGDVVSGQTVRATLYRPRDNTYYDFNDGTFKALASVTTLHRTMTENATNGTYYTTVSVDNGTIVSGDIVMTVSNDSAVYKDKQSYSVYFDRLEKVIKINR